MASDLENALRSAHQANIDRYRQLLKADLTDNERQFIERQLADEQAALRKITAADALLGSAVD